MINVMHPGPAAVDKRLGVLLKLYDMILSLVKELARPYFTKRGRGSDE